MINEYCGIYIFLLCKILIKNYNVSIILIVNDDGTKKKYSLFMTLINMPFILFTLNKFTVLSMKCISQEKK